MAMIGKDQDPSIGKDTQIQPGEVKNPEGRPKGALNWSTVVKEILDNPELAEAMLPSNKKDIPAWLKHLNHKSGAKIIAASMMAKAMTGDKQAADWLRKTGWGDKISVSAAKIEEVAAAVEELAAQDDDVSQRAADKLAEVPARPVVAAEPPVQDQGQERSDPNVQAEPNSAEIPKPAGEPPLQPNLESPPGGDNNTPSN